MSHTTPPVWDEPADPIDGGDTVGVVTNNLHDLPEMAAARERGFESETLEAPGWTWIWVPWPRSHRAWMPDRRVRFGWSYDSSLTDLGLFHRPPGRIWLLRPPGRFADLDAAFTKILRPTDERSIRVLPWPGLLEPMQQIVAELSEGDANVAW